MKFLFLIFLLYSFPVSADVRFITETENTAEYKRFQKLNQSSPSVENYTLDNAQRCNAEGYTYTSCASDMLLADPCPYDSSYYANCCPDTYRYTASECQAMGKDPGVYSCGGYYKCE